MRLYLDNIIFSLQKAGGISVLFYELLSRILKHCEEFEELKIIDYSNKNIFRKKIDIPSKYLIERRYAKIERYLNPRFPGKEKAIFHSSYYRISDDKNIINVTTVHDFIYEHYKNGLIPEIHKYQKGRAIKNSEAIICVSNSTKKDLLTYFPDINPEIIHVIYNGVSNDYRPVQMNELNESLKQFRDTKYVLYVGARHVDHKNFALVLKIISEFSDYKLVFVGG
jgi:mannosyltransferase